MVRRGEETSSNRAYSLINFAKARKACSGDPGPARSNATATLLKINTETSHFHDKEIFRPEWYSATETEKKEYYSRFYSPILFAMDMATSCQSIAKKTKLEGAEANVMKNGMWYFIAYVVYLLNDGDDSDYSHFTYSFDKISPEALRLLFENFADFYCKKLRATESDTISNAFKTSNNYRKLKECRYKGTSFYQNVCDLFDKKEAVSYDETMGMASPSSIRRSPYPNTGMQVIYNGIPHLLAPVVTDPKKASVALAKIVSEMERRYDIFEEKGVKNIWLTADAVTGIPFWLACNFIETGEFSLENNQQIMSKKL